MNTALSRKLSSLLTLGLTACAGSTQMLAENETAARRPNILFILTDDQGVWTLGNSGDPNAFTPELDRLAGRGVLLKNCYAAAAVSSPSRVGILTGRYSSEFGINNFLASGEQGIPESTPTWPAVLRSAGYRTALVGKWHLGDATAADLPTAHGYEYFSGWPTGGKLSRDPRIQVEGKWKTFKGQYTSDVLVDMTIDYIERFKDEPFAISLHFWAPHANQGVPEDYTPTHKDRTWLPLSEDDLAHWKDRDLQLADPDFPNLDKVRTSRMLHEYHASVSSVDRNVGRLMKKLDELGLLESTLVIFTSDQGFMVGQHGLWHKGNAWWLTKDRCDPRGAYNDFMHDRPLVVRDNLYDHVLRVPTIVSWPGKLPEGRVNQGTVTHLDWFPTILAAAGLTTDESQLLRGKNRLASLRGEGAADNEETVGQHVKLRSYRTPEWKLIRDFTRIGRDELYNLKEDPAEKNNLIRSDSPEAKAARVRLDKKLRAQMREIKDPLDVYAEAWPLK